MQLKPGEVVVYYADETSLARRRGNTKRQLDLQIAVADAAWQAALGGWVDLLQRRKGPVIQYLAIGRRKIDHIPVRPHYEEAEVRRTKAA